MKGCFHGHVSPTMRRSFVHFLHCLTCQGEKPLAFKIGAGKVIKCWEEGVMAMKLGEVAQFTCTPEYGYGSNGYSAWGILPDSTLRFEIELLSVR